MREFQDMAEIAVLAEGLVFPEGPVFDHTGDLWFVELKAGRLVRYREGIMEWFPSGQGSQPNGNVVTRNGDLINCDYTLSAVRRFTPRTGRFTILVDSIDGAPLLAPNDLTFDEAGNLLFTAPGDSETSPIGYVCCLTPGGTLTKIARDMYFPNGLALADGGRTLVIAETYRHRLWKGGWDPDTREWVDPAPWADVGGTVGPDGMAFGQDGNLYVAVFGSGQLKVVNPEGRVIHAWDLPGQNPTNAAFDPSGMLGLVVTEAEKGLLLRIEAPTKGLPLFDGGEAWD